MDATNELKLVGQIVKVYPVKYTPVGLPIVSFVLEHKSRQFEAGKTREVKCRIYCLIVGAANLVELELAEKFVAVSGFLNQNARSQLVLHINQLKFLDKGN